MILNMLRAKTKQIKEIRELQKQSLQNNPDEYMTGLYNGMEMAVAILKDREPIFETYIKEPEKTRQKILQLILIGANILNKYEII